MKKVQRDDPLPMTFTMYVLYVLAREHIPLFVGDLGLIGKLRSSRAGPGLPAVQNIV